MTLNELDDALAFIEDDPATRLLVEFLDDVAAGQYLAPRFGWHHRRNWSVGGGTAGRPFGGD